MKCTYCAVEKPGVAARYPDTRRWFWHCDDCDHTQVWDHDPNDSTRPDRPTAPTTLTDTDVSLDIKDCLCPHCKRRFRVQI